MLHVRIETNAVPKYTYAGLLGAEGHELEAALDIVQQTEVLASLGNRQHIWRHGMSRQKKKCFSQDSPMRPAG